MDIMSMVADTVVTAWGYLWSHVSKVKDLLSIFAIIVGGVWSYILFIKRRQRYPRANVTHQIQYSEGLGNKRLVNVSITISNKGDVLLCLVSGEIWIQQVSPPSIDVRDSIKKNVDPVEQGQTEIAWPLIASRNLKWDMKEFEIEPGESDQILCDFIIAAELKTIEVYSYFKNASKHGKEIGWRLTTIHDFNH